MNIITKENIFNKAFEILKDYINIDNLNIEIVKDNNFYIEIKNITTIHYTKTNEVFYAVGQILSNNYDVKESKFDYFGVMIDNARNGVLNVETIKRDIVILSLLGYNFLGLYIEDCIEIENEPMFGYMRGRFTKKEIEEIVNFSEYFGIEIIPYIETLAHLPRIFNHWKEYYNTVHDIHDILMIDNERTYELIENYIKAVRNSFKSNHIHLGLDEPFNMCDGTYKDKHGIVDKKDTLVRHTDRVIEIAKKYGFSVEAWGDTFYKHQITSSKHEDLTLTLWSYYNNDVSKNDVEIKKYKQITDNISFATTSHRYFGYTPYNYYSSLIIDKAIKSAIKNNIKRFTITSWGDDGNECLFSNTLGSIIKGSKSLYGYSDKVMNNLSRILTGYTFKEWCYLDYPNKVFDKEFDMIVNPSKYLLYEDVFYGIDDKADNLIYSNYFRNSYKILKKLSKKDSYYNINFLNMSYLSLTLMYKNDIRQKLLEFYKNKDKEKIKNECIPLINNTIKSLTKFHNSMKELWHKEQKPNGYEIIDLRLSGLASRLKYIKERLEEYISNKVDIIYELEELSLQPIAINNEYNGAAIYNNYGQNISPQTLTTQTYF